MKRLDELRELGYTVDDAGDGSAIAVRGHGIATMVDPNDAAAIASLVDGHAHTERARQAAAAAAAVAVSEKDAR